MSQYIVSARKYRPDSFESLVGQEEEVFAESFDGVCFAGRAYFNAPDIDGKVFFTGARDVKIGERVRVRFTDYKDYDLFGEIK